MKKVTRKILIVGLMLLGATPSFAQFTLDGEIRPRFEARHGYKSVADSNDAAAAFVEQRTRLNFGYKTEGYIFKVTMQYINVWGSQPQLINSYTNLNPDGSYFDFHEAWGEALMSDNWSLKFGRQEIALDDDRIFGSVAWTQQARSHDAAILKFKKNKLKADFAVAYNQDKAALKGTEASKGSYKAFQYLWLHNDFGENFGASVLFLNNGKEQLDYDSSGTISVSNPVDVYYKDNYSQTIGTRLTFKKNKLSINGAFYTQMGVDGNRNTVFSDVAGEYNKEISAMNYGVDVSYKVTEKFAATLGYEYLSGNSQVDTNSSYKRVDHAFNPFYGTNHKFNGLMDYFYVGNHAGSVGLQDIYVKGKYTADKFWVGLDVHLFSAANHVWDGFKYADDLKAPTAALLAATTQAEIDAANADIKAINDKKYTGYTMSSGLGTELDLTFGFNLAKGVVFKGGYSMMMATETLAYLKGTTDYQGQGRTDQNSTWGWAMIIIKPQFITGEKKEEVKN
ncbi:MAG: hypothetical protein J5I47_02565 [Vicingus serpentipes]|nr:hypothetical protein [Vicingus serpentipes]